MAHEHQLTDAWRVTIDGQPPSVNHTYKIGRRPRVDPKTHRALYNDDGSVKLVSRLVKDPAVQDYQDGVTMIVRAARPSGWKPAKRVRIIYHYYLKGDIDCDNMKKAMNDAIAAAIGANDKAFMACDGIKELGHAKPRVELEIGNE